MPNEHLEALAHLVPTIEAGTFEPGNWAGGQTLEDGTLTFPYYNWGEGMMAFVKAAGPLMMPGFDWVTWKDTPEAQAVREDIGSASGDDLRKLITTLVRQERFVDGLLAIAYEEGVLLRICQRAKILCEAAA